MKVVTDRRGYITLEAAVILPVFIMAVVSLIYYINVFSIHENIFYSTVEESWRLASKASVVKAAPAFRSELENRIQEENPAVNSTNIRSFRYLYWDGDLDNMIAVDGEHTIKMHLPLDFAHDFTLNCNVKCRGFTGKSSGGNTMSFEEMESEGVWDPVWIFPSSGEKYHNGACTYVKANAREMVLTADIKRRFNPCSLCEAETADVGAFVYCFMENGEAYHLEKCRQVTKYAVEINRQEAISKGYAACSKCGGG